MLRFGRLINDKIHGGIMILTVVMVVLTPVVIFFTFIYKSWLLLDEGNTLSDLLFSTAWEPMAGKFGFLPFILSSLLITLLAVLISAPLCLMVALYLTQYADRWFVRIMVPVSDILAGIPSVVYGAWGILVLVPFISETMAPLFGVISTGYTLLTGALVLSIMIIPFILNLLIEMLHTVPVELTEAGLSLGTTRWQTIRHIIIRRIRPGIISATGLGLARAFGETIAVLMVAGNVVQIPSGLFSPCYPLPALIANNYGEMMSIPLYDSALMFAALLLFVIILVFNLFSRMTIYRLERSI